MQDRDTLHGPGFEIELGERQGYLRAHVRGGADSVEVSVAYWAALGAECRRRGVSCVLVIEELEPFGDPGPDVFETVTDAMVGAGFRDIRLAFVDAREEVEANEMGMIVGADKGLAMMMFSSESIADHWLRFGGRGRG
ncbi:MAG: hypothetical protein HYV17_16110 [Xanthomonadales bacterium]|nr:hypothetical protein [Xanthomonadales bacterium]